MWKIFELIKSYVLGCGAQSLNFNEIDHIGSKVKQQQSDRMKQFEKIYKECLDVNVAVLTI